MSSQSFFGVLFLRGQGCENFRKTLGLSETQHPRKERMLNPGLYELQYACYVAGYDGRKYPPLRNMTDTDLRAGKLIPGCQRLTAQTGPPRQWSTMCRL